jgi:hypothetical protein
VPDYRTFAVPGEVLVGSRHVHTLRLIFLRTFLHSSGTLARIFLMADSSILDGNRLPHRGQFCGSSTPARVDLRGGPPERLELVCGCSSSGRSMNSYDIAGLILPWFCHESLRDAVNYWLVVQTGHVPEGDPTSPVTAFARTWEVFASIVERKSCSSDFQLSQVSGCNSLSRQFALEALHGWDHHAKSCC